MIYAHVQLCVHTVHALRRTLMRLAGGHFILTCIPTALLRSERYTRASHHSHRCFHRWGPI